MADGTATWRDAEGSVRIGDRTLTFLRVGDPEGPLVLHNHGGPSSRLEAWLLDEPARDKGLQLVCVDRPGQGKSDPQPDRTFASWAADLEVVADALDAEQFAVTGWSEGGPWAMAAAAYIDPARLVHVSSIAGGSYGAFGKNWAAKYESKADVGGLLALHFHPGFRLMYDLLGVSTRRFSKRYKKALLKAACPADREALADDRVMSIVMDTSRECFRQGAEGLVIDATLLHEPWPFDVRAIERPVHVWQGTADTLVPAAINKTLADRMPDAVWHEVEGGGHLIAVTCAPQILEIAADDLANSDRGEAA